MPYTTSWRDPDRWIDIGIVALAVALMVGMVLFLLH